MAGLERGRSEQQRALMLVMLNLVQHPSCRTSGASRKSTASRSGTLRNLAVRTARAPRPRAGRRNGPWNKLAFIPLRHVTLYVV